MAGLPRSGGGLIMPESNHFSATEGQNLKTLLTDFVCQVNGDHGRMASFSPAKKTEIIKSIGLIKYAVDRLVYAAPSKGTPCPRHIMQEIMEVLHDN